MLNAVTRAPIRSFASHAVALAFGVSLLLHFVFLVGLPAIRMFHFQAPIPIEVLPMKLRPPAPPSLDLPKPPDGNNKPVKPRAPGAGAPAKPKPPPPPAPDLHAVGPATANITLILRGPLFAKSPYKEGVDQLLSMLPDYHTLLDGTGLSPFDDLEALLIATPDPRDVTASFLAARHRGDARIRALAQRSLGGGDPRQFRALGDDLMLLGRPDDLLRITKAESGDTTSPDAVEAQRWLTALRSFDAGSKDAAFSLTISDLPALIRISGGALPLPRTIRLAMSAEASPATRLVLLFDTTELAQRFAQMWPELREKLADSAPMFGGALDGLKLTREGREVELLGRLPESQLRMAFTFLKLLTPRTPSPATPPPTPQTTPVPTQDPDPQ